MSSVKAKQIRVWPEHKKTATTCYVRPDQMEKLRALSKVTGVPMAVYIRRGIDQVLKRHEG